MSSRFQNGSIRKRGRVFELRWWVRTATRRKRESETVRDKTITEAKSILADRVREANQGKVEPTAVSFQQFADTQWASYTEQRWKPSTRKSKGNAISKHILPHFAKHLLSEITPSMILAFQQSKLKSKLHPCTVAGLHTLLVDMFNRAVELDLLSTNPAKRVKAPRWIKQEKPSLTASQVRSVIAAAPLEHRGLLTVTAMTGLRIGEVLGLKWRDIDLDGATLTVRRSMWGNKEQSPKTAGSARTKPMSSSLVAALRTHLALSHYRAPDDYVFASPTGRPFRPDWLRAQVLYPALSKAGIQRNQARAYGFHLLRHTAGSLLHESNGGDLKAVQQFLGHSSMKITADIYTHLRRDAALKTAEQLDSVVFGNA
jgi:integrase